jgi:hypothetical protein
VWPRQEDDRQFGGGELGRSFKNTIAERVVREQLFNAGGAVSDDTERIVHVALAGRMYACSSAATVGIVVLLNEKLSRHRHHGVWAVRD